MMAGFLLILLRGKWLILQAGLSFFQGKKWHFSTVFSCSISFFLARSSHQSKDGAVDMPKNEFSLKYNYQATEQSVLDALLKASS